MKAEEALAQYEAIVRTARDLAVSCELSKDQRIREQGLYFVQSIQTTAFNMYMAPRQQFPSFYIHPVFMPFELAWGVPSPNFLYRFAFLDGRHTYRVYGKAKDAFWVNFQALRGFWGDLDHSSLAVIDFDEMPKAPDGGYEIFLGPNPPADPQGKVWIKLDPVETITLNVREAVYDWTATSSTTMKIELLDRDSDASLHIGEADLVHRLAKAGRWVQYNMRYCVGSWQSALLPRAGGPAEPGDTIDPALVRDKSRWNRFNEARAPGDASTNAGNPLSSFSMMMYDLAPDEALIIEFPRIDARFWDIQLADVWGQTVDYSYHHSSINGHEARVDGDGVFRAVLAGADPGIVNWLDYAHVPKGRSLLRRYKADRRDVPTTKLVKLADVMKHLPADTACITPEHRAQEMDVRRRASLARYGM
jgi:hypothetical protein